MEGKTKILIADDHQIVIDGLVSLLQAENRFEVKAVTNGAMALELAAIDKVKKGKSFFSDEVHEALRDKYFHRREPERYEKEIIITKREKEIVQLLAKEYTNEKIAEELNISYRTVETHRKNIMQKTDSHNLAGLLKYFYSQNLLK